MNKTLKYVAIAAGTLAVLLGAAAAIIVATFNPNDYKPLIIREVQQKKQRTLAIPGEIKLSFFPKLGADLGNASLSEHGSAAEFASVDKVRVSLALIPLLSRQLVVDRMQVEGLRINLKRNKDGSTNVDDLLSKDEGGQAVRFDIDGVHISNAQLRFDDRMESRVLELRKLQLDSGRLADGVPGKLQLGGEVRLDQPAVDAIVALNTGFSFELGSKRFAVKGLDGELKGSVLDWRDLSLKLSGDADLAPAAKRFSLDDIKLIAGAKQGGRQGGQPIDIKLDIPKLVVTDRKVEGGKLSGEAHLAQGTRQVAATFSMPSFEGSPQAFKVPALALQASLQDKNLDVTAKANGALQGDIDKLLFHSPQLAFTFSGKQEGRAIDGTLATPVTLDLAKHLVELPKIAADLTLPNPGGGTLALKAGGSAGIDLAKQNINASLKGSLDESSFDAKLGMVKFSSPLYTFDVGIDKLDLDRYQARPAATATNAAAAQKNPGADKPADLGGLRAARDLHAEGSLRVGALKVKNIRVANARLGLHAAGGKLEVNPLALDLYGGHAAGAMSLAVGEPMHFATRQNLAGIDVGSLLKDATGKNTLEGKGDVLLDVSANGDDIVQLKRTLAGTARLDLRDGAVRGVNIAQAVREAKAKIGAIRGDALPQSGTASAAEKTDFSALNASFRIANGVAHNDDLAIKSPLLRIAGAGDVDIGNDKLDYVVRATVVSTLEGQGGPELQALKGVTVPVKLAGPFASLNWRIDFAGMASELAKQKVDEKKKELRTRAQQAIDEQKAKIGDQLKDQLKGLFGR